MLPPQVSGLPLTRWSLPRLLVHLVTAGVLGAGVLSAGGLRTLLHRAGVSYQRTRTWKVPPDPRYRAKRDRIRSLYRRAEAGTLKDARVVCFDEFGPLSVRPSQGRAWARRRRPRRLRSDYHRRHGVRYPLGAYDVGADLLWGEMTEGTGAERVLAFLRAIRARYPSPLRISLSWTTSPPTGPPRSAGGPGGAG